MYCLEMCSCFPELKLCDLDWKAEQIATDNYPSWHSTWDSKMVHQNIKVEQDSLPTLGGGSQVKCVHGESMTTHPKRAKVKRTQDIEIYDTMAMMNPTGAMIPAGTMIPAGAMIPAGTMIPEGMMIPVGTMIPAGIMEGCQVRQPTLRWSGQTGSRYLRCTEVGM
jgi:hypothetical protein